MKRGQRVRASGHIPGQVDARAGERVLGKILIRSEIDDVGAERYPGVKEVRMRVDEAYVGLRADYRAAAGYAGVLVYRRKVKGVAGHFAALRRMDEVAVKEGPPIGLAGHRNEIDPAKIEKVRDRRALDRSGRVVQRDVARDHEPIELQVHRKGVARYREAVAGTQAYVPVALDQETVVVKVETLGVQVQNRSGRLRARRRRGCCGQRGGRGNQNY